ncbi:MAG: hypothetical protein E5Y04_28685 [Mesorhizobium sp.]|nr:MAG: hypothetical protein E5Y04_28685 [Mesorhizobium sp.]
MFGDRYFGARYFGNRYFGPGGNALPVIIDDGHDGKPSSEAWEEHRQKAERLRETLAKARRKANGEVEPETPEQEPESPLDEPVLAPKDYAALVAALVANSMPRPAVEADDEDEMLAILLLAA